MNKIKRIMLFLIVICMLGTIKVLTVEKDVEAKQTIFVMGDSKSCYYSKDKYPRRGWVQQFIPMLKNNTKVHAQRPEEYKAYSKVVRYTMDKYNIENWSISGISCKTFYQSGRFSAMIEQVKKNDYVIIALQHNDKKPEVGEKVTDYKDYLIYFTQQIQKKGGKVVFMTTPPKNYTNRQKFTIYVPEYRKAMLQVAKLYKCKYIDLSKICTDYFNFRGKKYVNTLYMKLKPGKYPAWEKGIDDNTHFCKNGAKVLARMIAVDLQVNHQISILNHQLKQDTKGLYQVYRKAATYKNKRKYTKKTWNNMIAQRNKAWKILYTPNATNQQCRQAEKSLKRSLKGLKRKHG